MVDDVTAYLAGLSEPRRSRVAEIYSRARRLVPEAVEGLSYGMPSLVLHGKGLISVMSTEKHIGVYPFGSLAELDAVAVAAGLETTKGSIHLREGQHLPDDLLARLLSRRVAQLDRR